MPKMTKQEFALRLLIWLLPWPLSKALPRSLLIYYFGPQGYPDFFDLFPYWLDPDFEPPPYFAWPKYGDPFLELYRDKKFDPFNPPDPPQLPDLNSGPVNFFDLYALGSLQGKMSHKATPGVWTSHHDDSDWKKVYWHFDWNGTAWVKTGGLGLGNAYIQVEDAATWQDDYRPTKVKVSYSGAAAEFWIQGTGQYMLGSVGTYVALTSGQEADLNDYDDDIYRFGIKDPTADVTITNIEFYA